MHFSNDPNILRAIIMDHYSYPRNKKPQFNDQNYKMVNVGAEGCIDDINLFVLVADGVIKDIVFDGVACAISTATTSIMSELLKGKNIIEANNIIDNYLNMIYEKPYDQDLLKEAIAFKNTHKQVSRIRCASDSWVEIKKIINEK